MAKEKHPLTNWYKLFSAIFCVIYVSLILMILLSCPPSVRFDESLTGFLRNVGCVAYGLAAFFVFIAGLLPAMLGWQHVKNRKRSAMFFHTIFGVYFLGFMIVMWLKFIR